MQAGIVKLSCKTIDDIEWSDSRRVDYEELKAILQKRDCSVKMLCQIFG